MEQFLSAFSSGHGHSHGSGGQCPGHSHGGMGNPQMTDEMRKEFMKVMKERMQLMQEAAKGGLMHSHGHVFRDPNDPGPSSFSTLLHGYGHEGGQPPVGWGSLTQNAMTATGSDDRFSQLPGTVERDRFWSPTIPLLGRLRIVKDRGGMFQSSAVILYWLYGNWATWSAILLPYYADGALSLSLVLS